MLEFDVFGRRILLERQATGGWRAWYPGADGKRREATDVRTTVAPTWLRSQRCLRGHVNCSGSTSSSPAARMTPARRSAGAESHYRACSSNLPCGMTLPLADRSWSAVPQSIALWRPGSARHFSRRTNSFRRDESIRPNTLLKHRV
jgi:hypothetical protein